MSSDIPRRRDRPPAHASLTERLANKLEARGAMGVGKLYNESMARDDAAVAAELRRQAKDIVRLRILAGEASDPGLAAIGGARVDVLRMAVSTTGPRRFDPTGGAGG